MKKNNKGKAQSKTNANTVLPAVKLGGAVVLCGFCKKPIHIDDFGGMQKDMGFFHGACFIKYEAEKQIENHKKPKT